MMVKRFDFEMESEDDYNPYCAVIEGENGEYVLASDYDALEAELAKEAKWRQLTQAGVPFRELKIQAERIRALEAALDDIASRTDWDRDDCGKPLNAVPARLESTTSGGTVDGQ